MATLSPTSFPFEAPASDPVRTKPSKANVAKQDDNDRAAHHRPADDREDKSAFEKEYAEVSQSDRTTKGDASIATSAEPHRMSAVERGDGEHFEAMMALEQPVEDATEQTVELSAEALKLTVADGEESAVEAPKAPVNPFASLDIEHDDTLEEDIVLAIETAAGQQSKDGPEPVQVDKTAVVVRGETIVAGQSRSAFEAAQTQAAQDAAIEAEADERAEDEAAMEALLEADGADGALENRTPARLATPGLAQMTAVSAEAKPVNVENDLMAAASGDDLALDGEVKTDMAKMKMDMTAPSAAQSAEAARQVMAAIKTDKGSGAIEVRLDPPELGKVRINLQVDRTDMVTAVISAEKPETLDMMRRHADELVKELEAAGYDGVDLDFQSHNGDGAQDGFDADGGYQFGGNMSGEGATGNAADAEIVYLSMRDDNRLDRLV